VDNSYRLRGGREVGRRVVLYAPWSGASPSLLIVARVASIVNSGMATHGTLDTNTQLRSYARLRLRKKWLPQHVEARWMPEHLLIVDRYS
jgi:hypothetical protein